MYKPNAFFKVYSCPHKDLYLVKSGTAALVYLSLLGPIEITSLKFVLFYYRTTVQ